MENIGSDAEIWIAIFTAMLVLATAALAGIAWQEIGSARNENRETQTLLACGRYDTDPIIFTCQERLVAVKSYKKRNDAALIANADKIRQEALTVLNFLDAIAIGVSQGLYIEHLAREHLINIVRKHVAEFIDSGFLE